MNFSKPERPLQDFRHKLAKAALSLSRYIPLFEYEECKELEDGKVNDEHRDREAHGHPVHQRLTESGILRKVCIGKQAVFCPIELHGK
jgi:hypothetical protein